MVVSMMHLLLVVGVVGVVEALQWLCVAVAVLLCCFILRQKAWNWLAQRSPEGIRHETRDQHSGATNLFG